MSAQARRRERRVWALVFPVLAVLPPLVTWAAFGLRSIALALALIAVMYALYRLADREASTTVNWIRGARSEAAVGETLDTLQGEGYTVIHDIKTGEGNIDHLVSGPTGVYLVETKHRSYREEQLRKAKRQAAKLSDSLGVWVTPVICLDRRRVRSPYRHHGVWIVSRERLLEWLCARRNAMLEFERLAAFSDQL